MADGKIDISEHYQTEGKLTSSARELGITRGLLDIIMILGDKGSLSQDRAMAPGNICEALPSRVPSTVCAGFNAGEEKGLLKRELNPRTPRTRLIYLTGKGNQVYKRVYDEF